MAIAQVEGFSFAYPPETGADAVSNLVGDEECPMGATQRHAGEGRAVPSLVLDQVSLTVEEGAFCLVTGPTGCGKTTLLRALKPELAPHGTMAGNIQVAGRSVVRDGQPCEYPAAESASAIGFVMQDPDAQIVCDSVWHELAFGLENLGTAQPLMRRRVAEVAHFFGIEPWIDMATAELSGGQKQLLNLAAVLALRPRLIVLDEPTAQLDPDSRQRFLLMLARVNRELGITVICATHAPERAEPYATQYYAMAPIASSAPVDAVLVHAEARRSRTAAQTQPALEARGVYFRYTRTAPWVLRGMDVAVRRSTVHALVGGNGCGKTTLLNVLAGVAKPQRGSVRNACVGAQAFLPQDPKALLVCDSVAEELAEWRERAGYDAADEPAMATRFGFDGMMGRHPYDLSGGQRQKLALAKLLLCRPQLLLLDEPGKGLDPASAADLARILREEAEAGTTIVLVTHDLDFALAVADEVTMLFDGEAACTDFVTDFFQDNLVYCASSSARLFGALAQDEPAVGERGSAPSSPAPPSEGAR